MLRHSLSTSGTISGNWAPSLICTQPPCARGPRAQWTFLWSTLWAGSLSTVRTLCKDYRRFHTPNGPPTHRWGILAAMELHASLYGTMVSYEDLPRSYGLPSGVDLPLHQDHAIVQEFYDKWWVNLQPSHKDACAVLAWAACETAPPCQLLRQPDKWVTDKKRQLGSSATFFACIFLSASIDGYVRYARRALHLAPIHPPAASGSADAPPRTAYGALLRDHNRQLVAALTSMNSAPSAGATPNQAPAYVLPLPGLFYLRVIATEHAEPLLQQGLRDVAAYMARQMEGAPASLNVSFDICMASATYAPTLELAQSVRLTSGSKEPGLVAECAVWGANRPLCPRRSIGPRSLLTSGRR